VLNSSQPYSGWLRNAAAALALGWPRSASAMAERMAARCASRFWAGAVLQASKASAASGIKESRFMAEA